MTSYRANRMNRDDLDDSLLSQYKSFIDFKQGGGGYNPSSRNHYGRIIGSEKMPGMSKIDEQDPVNEDKNEDEIQMRIEMKNKTEIRIEMK